jgi:hypothetical protein
VLNLLLITRKVANGLQEVKPSRDGSTRCHQIGFFAQFDVLVVVRLNQP